MFAEVPKPYSILRANVWVLMIEAKTFAGLMSSDIFGIVGRSGDDATFSLVWR